MIVNKEKPGRAESSPGSGKNMCQGPGVGGNTVCLRNQKKAAKVAGSHDNRQGFTGHAKESGLQWDTTGGLKQMNVRVSPCLAEALGAE